MYWKCFLHVISSVPQGIKAQYSTFLLESDCLSSKPGVWAMYWRADRCGLWGLTTPPCLKAKAATVIGLDRDKNCCATPLTHCRWHRFLYRWTLYKNTIMVQNKAIIGSLRSISNCLYICPDNEHATSHYLNLFVDLLYVLLIHSLMSSVLTFLCWYEETAVE